MDQCLAFLIGYHDDHELAGSIGERPENRCADKTKKANGTLKANFVYRPTTPHFIGPLSHFFPLAQAKYAASAIFFHRCASGSHTVPSRGRERRKWGEHRVGNRSFRVERACAEGRSWGEQNSAVERTTQATPRSRIRSPWTSTTRSINPLNTDPGTISIGAGSAGAKGFVRLSRTASAPSRTPRSE